MPEQTEQQKRPPDVIEFPPDRVKFYEDQARKLLDAYGREFHEFIKGHEELEQEGDKVICLGEGTGYNIILAEEDMPLTSGKDLIFYNNYIGRPHHFGLLLAGMEAKEIIIPDIVRFGKKATKVLYDGSWTLNPDDEFEEEITYIDADGTTHKRRVNRTVETVVVFSPKSKTQAFQIADYLLDRVDATQAKAIEGSWGTPDIRATVSLRSVLVRPSMDFVTVISNILENGDSRLVILRQKKRFDRKGQNPNRLTNWKSKETPQNRKLAEYLVNRDFNVLP